MKETIEERLLSLNIYLPDAIKPAASYEPIVKSGKHLYVSGQLPLKKGEMVHTGLLGRDLSLSEGHYCAKWCVLNLLSQIREATGDLDKVKKIVKITVFVASTPDFHEQHLVANGASDLLASIFDNAGAHARSAFGVASLPMNAPVEIEAIIEI
ncbi:MAG: RidA family protein [Marinomonas sp.]|uniref:RidA family protein n=1 Tax=Marinomonas communis TaxID=28254 RepID=UPI00100492B1|nr:RidA family protein [Marinomonas communis]MCC4273804.1 RidA family protein [Marinomonas communis]RUM50295.1 MAG: RidA family protein [Marinomonas sp.]RUM55692.1 MAG: RidA family protein [Marinomonas sp.]